MSYFPHEFIHLYQDGAYSGGISQYHKKTGHPNIEFETFFLTDLFKSIYGYPGSISGAPSNSPLFYEYSEWIYGLSGMWPFTYSQFLSHHYNGYTYLDFLTNFKNYMPGCNYPINSTLQPAVIIEFLHYSNCW